MNSATNNANKKKQPTNHPKLMIPKDVLVGNRNLVKLICPAPFYVFFNAFSVFSFEGLVLTWPS